MIPMQSPPRVAVLAVLLALTGPLLAGCGGGSSAAGDGRVQVVTTFYPLEYVASRVAGRHADVVDLTQAGKEPHDIELSPRQTAQFEDAGVVVYERGFQANVDQAVDQSGSAGVVDVSGAVDLHGDDPHFWLDPTRLAEAAGAFESKIAAVDPAHAADYARNLTRLRRDLVGLDAAFRRGLGSCRVTTIVVSHDAFGYLGERYGLTVVGIDGLSPDAEPSPAHIRRLQDLVRTQGITTVFSERLASPELTDSLAGDLGIHTAVLDPVEGLSAATAHEDYLSLMRGNLRALRTADQCA
jgi:zinc transport system substrate-binding protein